MRKFRTALEASRKKKGAEVGRGINTRPGWSAGNLCCCLIAFDSICTLGGVHKEVFPDGHLATLPSFVLTIKRRNGKWTVDCPGRGGVSSNGKRWQQPHIYVKVCRGAAAVGRRVCALQRVRLEVNGGRGVARAMGERPSFT